MTSIEILEGCGTCGERNKGEDIDCVLDKYGDGPLTILLASGHTIKNVYQSSCNGASPMNFNKIQIEFFTDDERPMRFIKINAGDIIAICGGRQKQ